MITSSDAIEILRKGNQRFVSDKKDESISTHQERREQLVNGQQPFAIILGCSDSRVPAEIIFDQGLGELFVIRVAGNIVAPSQIGSIEFAADQFGTKLVVVLGHSQCGAVSATLKELEKNEGNHSPNLKSIVERIRPALEPLLKQECAPYPDKLLETAVRENIKASVEQLKQGSEILEKLIINDGLLIVGAEYSLETGEIDFFYGI